MRIRKKITDDVGVVTPITISGLSVSVIFNSATISWTTDIASTSRVRYGVYPFLTDSVTEEEDVSSLVTSHSVSLTNLAVNKSYLFEVASRYSGNGYEARRRGAFVAGGVGSWVAGNALGSVRCNYAVVKLANGKVLMIGGDAVAGNNAYLTCELFDPATNLWAATGSMARARSWGNAVLLNSGLVLAVGGTSDGGTTFHTTCELYDPVAGTWSDTGALTDGRIQFASWLLSNGKVLVAGGHKGSGNDLNSCELYDPDAGTWSATDSLPGNAVYTQVSAIAYKPRWPLFCTLGDGRPFCAAGTVSNGGYASKNTQTYNVSTDLWTVRENAPDYISGIEGNSCVVLDNGNALIVGPDFDLAPHTRKTCYIFNYQSNSWSQTGDLPQIAEGSTVFRMVSGEILQAGGSTDESDQAVVYSAKFNGSTWTAMASLTVARMFAGRSQGIVLDDGRCLFPGGQGVGTFNAVSSTDVYQ